MAKDYRKKKKSCVPLDGYQAEQLARLIIAETERKVHYGTERKPPPVLFSDSPDG